MSEIQEGGFFDTAKCDYCEHVLTPDPMDGVTPYCATCGRRVHQQEVLKEEISLKCPHCDRSLIDQGKDWTCPTCKKYELIQEGQSIRAQGTPIRFTANDLGLVPTGYRDDPRDREIAELKESNKAIGAWMDRRLKIELNTATWRGVAIFLSAWILVSILWRLLNK